MAHDKNTSTDGKYFSLTQSFLETKVRELQRALFRYLEHLRLRLGSRDARLQFAFLGVCSGCLAGAVMVAFRLVVDAPQTFFLGSENPENYEALTPLLHFVLPTLGGLTVGLLFERLAPGDCPLGIVHVMERLAYGEGQLPLKNAGVQFVSAALCILSGHSVGREGPAVHIGATCSSWLGQILQLPNNSILVLVGCGSAGAIAAAFNTPLAGVVFAMEVILVDYTLASFTPIILAAVSATAVSYGILGPTVVFQVPALSMEALGDLVYVVLLGIGIGLLSTLFVRLLVFFSQRLTTLAIWLRMTLAGALTGVVALFLPEILSMGYDTVNEALLGNLGMGLMLAVLAGKVLATAIGLGLGLPGGVIGPSLMMGALAGGAAGAAVAYFVPDHGSAPSLYAMLGMGAMMAATLNAPFTALITLVELTANPHIILPAMLAIITAELTSHYGFRTPSVFIALMRIRGLSYSNNPLSQFLRRLGVTHTMNRQVIRLPNQLSRSQLEKAVLGRPTWIAVQDNEGWLLTGNDLIDYLDSQKLTKEQTIDLTNLPIRRVNTAFILAQATLEAALRKMNQEKVDTLYVVARHKKRILGVITRADIERSYRLPLN